MITKVNTTRIKKDKMKTNAMIFYCVMFALPLIQFAIFYIGVNLNSILLAFKRYTLVQLPDGTRTYDTIWVGFENFKNFFGQFKTNPNMKSIVVNSFIVCAAGIFITIPLNLLFSYYIYKKFFGSKLFQTILFLPTIISEVVMVFIFKTLASQVFTTIFGWKNLLDTANGQVFTTLLIFSTIIGLGSSCLVYSNAMSGIPKSLMEAAELDGCSPLKQFLHVVVPTIWPTIVSYVTLAFVGLTTNQIGFYSFFGTSMNSIDNKYWTMAAWSYYQLMKEGATQANYPYASAIGLILTLFVAPVAMILNHVLTKYGPSER